MIPAYFIFTSTADCATVGNYVTHNVTCMVKVWRPMFVASSPSLVPGRGLGTRPRLRSRTRNNAVTFDPANFARAVKGHAIACGGRAWRGYNVCTVLETSTESNRQDTNILVVKGTANTRLKEIRAKAAVIASFDVGR